MMKEDDSLEFGFPLTISQRCSPKDLVRCDFALKRVVLQISSETQDPKVSERVIMFDILVYRRVGVN